MTDREAFEACPDLQDYCDFSRCPDGTQRGIVVYNDPWTQGAWQGWQAALASERAKQAGPVHDNRAPVTEPHPLLSATHFCRDCRALWRQCDDFSMNLRSTQCCDKCDNTPVGDQLIPLTATPGWWRGDTTHIAPFRLLIAACNRLSNEREQLIARLRRFAVVLEARGETYDAETCEQAIASLSAPPAEPVAWMVINESGQDVYVTADPKLAATGQRALPLYTGPVTERQCTCCPDDTPPVPCPRKYALSECLAAAQQEGK